MSMDFELKLDGKTMSRFLLHYNYTKATGLFGILLGIASLAAVFIKWNMWNANQRVVWIVYPPAYTCEKRKTPDGTGRNADSSVLPY